MICHQIRRSSVYKLQLSIQRITNCIQRFEIRSLYDNADENSYALLSHQGYHMLQHSVAEQKLINKFKVLQCTQINKKYKFHNTLVQNSGIFRTSSMKKVPMYQSRRFVGDLATSSTAAAAAAAAAAVIGSNAPIGQYGFFIRLLYDNVLIEFCQSSLISLHSYTGLPWWANIVLVSIVARTLLTLPFALYQESNRAKVANIKVEMDDIVKELKAEANLAVRTLGWDERYTRSVYNRSLKQQWQKLIIRDNCHPAKNLIVILVQFPMWLCLSASLRNLCFMLPLPTPAAHETFMQLSVEGFGWISDLTSVDSYWVFPILLGVLNLANIEFGLAMRQQEITRAQKIISNIFRGLSLVMVPIAGIIPSCMGLYWVTSSAYNLGQNFILVSPRVRRFVGIPKSELDCENPYQLFYNNLKKKYAWIKKLKTKHA